MENGKQPIGFKTSATKVQGELDNIRQVLDAKKVEWAEIVQIGTRQSIQSRQDLQVMLKKSKSSWSSLNFQSDLTQYWMLVTLLGKLGVDVLEIHERLAKIEKAIAELRLAIK